jgi:hypothetical protein
MDAKSLSLSKKIDGGYLHVKKRDSNVNKKSKGGSNKSSKGYSKYLNRLQGLTGGGDCSTDKKKVSIQLAGSKKVYKSPKKSKVKGNIKEKGNIKDISQSTIIPKKAGPQKAEPKKAGPQKAEPKKKGIPITLPVTKGSLKKRRVSRSRCRSKSLTKRRTHDLKKGGKRISVSKIRNLSKKDVNNIQSKLKSIKGKSNEDIKKELDKQGIQVSGKSPSILKDIYMYSQLCGINIKRE